jgi:tocopherol O-methyltransferase
MIHPNAAQSTADVAAHYDDLDDFYRDIWGEHVHHGYWPSNRAPDAQAVEALVQFVAQRLDLSPGQQICDIGCGYGASARYLAAAHGVHVTGLTVSAAQARQAATASPPSPNAAIRHGDWLVNDFAAEVFDHAYAIESSEHMPDKNRFFAEAFRTLKPGGRFVICAWLAAEHPAAWEIKHLLEPICREGRLPSMGTESDYRNMAQAAGFNVTSVDDISAQVSRTWWLCAWRLAARLTTRPAYLRYLLNRANPNRIFAITLFRLLLAYRTKAMRYCVLTIVKP